MHPLEYYERIGFSHPSRPSRPEPLSILGSLTDYFRECSLAAFLARSRRIGWAHRNGHAHRLGSRGLAPNRSSDRVADLDPRVFFDADEDGNFVITPSEFVVLVVENIKGSAARQSRQPAGQGPYRHRWAARHKNGHPPCGICWPANALLPSSS